MDKKRAVKAALRLKDALENNGFKISKIILFGSFAAGTQHEGSDIDLIVVSPGFHDLDYWQRVDVLSKAIYEVFEPIEAIACSPEEWAAGDTTYYEYAKDGELIAGAA